MPDFNRWFLTCIQISQEAGKVVWYSYLLKNFPQSVVIHTVRGFGIVNKAEVDVFQEAGQVVWYAHLFQNFPQFFVIHTVKGFSIVNKTELDVFYHIITKQK